MGGGLRRIRSFPSQRSEPSKFRQRQPQGWLAPELIPNQKVRRPPPGNPFVCPPSLHTITAGTTEWFHSISNRRITSMSQLAQTRTTRVDTALKVNANVHGFRFTPRGY